MFCAQYHAGKNDVFSRLLKTYNLNVTQLDCEIKQEDLACIAGIFDDVEFYLDVLRLESSEKTDVRNLTRHGTHVAMNACLSIWKNHDTSSATYKALLDIILRLGKEAIAEKLCGYISN